MLEWTAVPMPARTWIAHDQNLFGIRKMSVVPRIHALNGSDVTSIRQKAERGLTRASSIGRTGCFGLTSLALEQRSFHLR